MNRHQRREELSLRILEVLAEDAGDVLGREVHEPEYIGSYSPSRT